MLKSQIGLIRKMIERLRILKRNWIYLSDGLIDNMKDVKSINKALDEEGLLETRRILKEAFRKMDPYYTKMAN